MSDAGVKHYAVRDGDGWKEIDVGRMIVIDDIQYSYGSLLMWSTAEREAVGVYEIGEPETPPGMMPTRPRLEERDGRPVHVYDYIEKPTNPYADFIPVPLLRQRIEALGMWDAFAAYLAQNPAEMLKVLTVEVGVDPKYPSLAAAFDAMDVPPSAQAIILAPPSNGVGVP